MESHSQPGSPVLSHGFSLPRSSPVSPVPSRHASCSVLPTHSSPVSRNVSPHSRPIQSFSRKRKGDSLMLKAPKEVQSDEGTTTRRSTRSSKTSGQLSLGSTPKTGETQSRRRHNKLSSALLSTNSSPPAWFSKSLSMLQINEPPFGDQWAELLELWLAFEKKEAFTEQKKLSPQSRPVCISEWIGRGCPTTWRPVIVSIPAFKKAFDAWWSILQPDWRMNDNGSIAFSEVDGDWEKLRKPRLNGIHSVIVALFYWGCKVQGRTTKHARWASSVEDCILVLRKLL